MAELRLHRTRASQRGLWLIAALPGVAVLRERRDCWRLRPLSPDRLWSEDLRGAWTAAAVDGLLDRQPAPRVRRAWEHLHGSGLFLQRFPTRRAALQALAAVCELAPETSVR